MGEKEPQAPRPLAQEWDHRFEEPDADNAHNSNLTLVMIDGAGKPHELSDAEIDRLGLGHIVTTAAGIIPEQRKPPREEDVPPLPPQSQQPSYQERTSIPEIYLG